MRPWRKHTRAAAKWGGAGMLVLLVALWVLSARVWIAGGVQVRGLRLSVQNFAGLCSANLWQSPDTDSYAPFVRCMDRSVWDERTIAWSW